MNTILILHGWGSSAKNWSRVKELLENQGCRVFIPNLPGFGKSPPPLQSWSIDDYAEWVGNYCEENNLSQIHNKLIEPFFLLGHSFGGSVAVKFSLKYPGKIQKLILIDTAGIRKKTLKKEVLKKISKLAKKFSFLPFFSFFRKIFYRMIKSDYFHTQEGVMRETYLKVINEDLSDDFVRLSIPTTLIWGKKDKITPLRHGYLIKEKIPGAKLEMLPDIFHNPQSENPELLVQTILKYL